MKRWFGGDGRKKQKKPVKIRLFFEISQCFLTIFQVFSSKKRHKYEIMQNGVPFFFLKGRV